LFFERYASAARQRVHTPFPNAIGRPATVDKPGSPKSVQRGVDRPILKINDAIARAPQRFRDCIPVLRTAGDRR
jgi:hypothetical protein